MIKEKTFLVRVDEPIHKEYKELCKKKWVKHESKNKKFHFKRK